MASKRFARVCFVAGVDLAHVGRQFGDREPITEDFLKWVESEDRALVDRLATARRAGFFQEVAKDQDKRSICGFSPLYSLIHLLDGAHGKHLKYSQAFTPETGSAVTFTSMIFRISCEWLELWVWFAWQSHIDSSVHVHAAVDADGLAGHEVAVVGSEEDDRADQVCGILIALNGAALSAIGQLLGGS